MCVQAKGSREGRASRSWRGREAPPSPPRDTIMAFCQHSCGRKPAAGPTVFCQPRHASGAPRDVASMSRLVKGGASGFGAVVNELKQTLFLEVGVCKEASLHPSEEQKAARDEADSRKSVGTPCTDCTPGAMARALPASRLPCPYLRLMDRVSVIGLLLSVLLGAAWAGGPPGHGPRLCLSPGAMDPNHQSQWERLLR